MDLVAETTGVCVDYGLNGHRLGIDCQDEGNVLLNLLKEFLSWFRQWCASELFSTYESGNGKSVLNEVGCDIGDVGDSRALQEAPRDNGSVQHEKAERKNAALRKC